MIKLKDLGKFYGISLTNSDITNYKIEIVTKEIYKAKKYLDLIKNITNSKKDVVIYLEDIKYGSIDETINKIKIIIPDFETYENYVFQRPDKNLPRIVIKLYNQEICEKIINFLKQLNLLLEDEKFCQGFMKTVIENHSITTNSEIKLPINPLSPHVKKALQTLKTPYTLTMNEIKIKKLSKKISIFK